MRVQSIFSIGLLVIGSVAIAQQPPTGSRPTPVIPTPGAGNAIPAVPTPPPVTLDPKNSLDAVLMQWERKMAAVSALEADCTRTEIDKLTNTTEIYVGKAKLQRPDKAMLFLRKQTKPDVYEQYFYTGKYLYEYRPQNKKLNIHVLTPPKPGQIADDSFLGFMFGMRAEEAKGRYEIQFAPKAEDEWYYYLFVKPKSTADQAEFTIARLALFKNTLLPRQLEFEMPNKNVVRWDILKIDPNAKVSPTDFSPPQAPKDWQVIQVPHLQQPTSPGAPSNPTPPPTKVRPSGG